MLKSPFMIISISYIIGILWGIYFKNIFSFFIIHILLIILFLIICKNKKVKILRFIRSKFKKIIIILIILFSTLGFIQIEIKNNKIEKLYKSNVIVATIISDKYEEEYSNKYIINIERYNIQAYLFTNKSTKLEYGNLIEIQASIEKPKEQRNTYGFDNNLYCKSINIVGNIYSNQYVILKKCNVNIINKVINNIKISMKEKIYNSVKTKNKYVLEAFLLGDKSNMPEYIKDNFTKSSLSHLLAISGTHISIIMSLFTLFFAKMNISKRKTYISSIVILCIYILITNSAISVIRVSIITILSILAKLFHRKSYIYNNVFISMIIILIKNPYSIFNLSFLLSYGGIFGIIIYNTINKTKKDNRKIISYIKNSILISITIQIIIFPIIINTFNCFSIYFFISTLIVMPIIVAIINLGIINIFIMQPLSSVLGKIIDILINLIIAISEIISKLPFSEVYVSRINMFLCITYYCIIIYLLYLYSINKIHIIKHFLRKHILSILTIICIYLVISNIYSNIGIKPFEIFFIDVRSRGFNINKNAT